MTEKQKEEILLSILKKVEEQNEKIESRDNLLITLTKEVALLRIDTKQKIDKNIKQIETLTQNIARAELDMLDKIDGLYDTK